MKKFIKILLIVFIVLLLLPKPFFVGGVAGYRGKCFGYSFGVGQTDVVIDAIYTGFCIGIPYPFK